MACRISTPRPITLCSIYLPPPSKWSQADLASIILQLPAPILLLGDFNAHHSLWGCSNTDGKGQEIEKFLLQNNLCLINKSNATYIHPATGSRSSIDLAISDPALFLDLTWHVHDDLCGSDHLPIILSHMTVEPPLDRPPRWNLQRADWTLFESLCRDRLGATELENRADPIGYFSTTLLSIAEESIPCTSSKARNSCKPWFNDDCKTAVSDRKKALQALSSNVNATNLSNLRVYRAKARRTIKLSKRNCWRSYVSKLNSQTPMKKTFGA